MVYCKRAMGLREVHGASSTGYVVQGTPDESDVGGVLDLTQGT